MSILLQPCSGKIAMDHFEETITNGVPLAYFDGKIDESSFNKLKELKAGTIKAWGFVPKGDTMEAPSSWSNLKEGDLVFFYGKKQFFHLAIVHFKLHNQEIAKELWQVDDQGRTWEYMYFIREDKSIQLPYDPSILIRADGEQYSSKHIVRGAQLLTDRNAIVMKSYLEEKEGTSLDEDNIDPTYEEEVSFYKKVKEPLTIKEAEDVIKKIALEAQGKPVKEKVKIAKMLVRNPKFSRLVKERAGYICEICGEKPFMQKNACFYAEAHHKNELAKTKIDNPEDMICVCPTCHRVIHFGTESELQKRYTLKLKR